MNGKCGKHCETCAADDVEPARGVGFSIRLRRGHRTVAITDITIGSEDHEAHGETAIDLYFHCSLRLFVFKKDFCLDAFNVELCCCCLDNDLLFHVGIPLIADGRNA